MPIKCRLFIAVFLLLSHLETASAQIYTAADLGTSFSPHGAGLSVGYSWDERYSVELGSGYSKNNIVGLPVSLETRIALPLSGRQSLFIGLGGTYYQGSGRRTVSYNEIDRDKGYRVESDAKWRIAYARANIGLMFPGPISRTKWFGDVGAASVVFSRIDAEPTGDYDDSNLGEPAGIATDGPYDINSMGRGDFGVYARLGIQYVFE